MTTVQCFFPPCPASTGVGIKPIRPIDVSRPTTDNQPNWSQRLGEWWCKMLQIWQKLFLARLITYSALQDIIDFSIGEREGHGWSTGWVQSRETRRLWMMFKAKASSQFFSDGVWINAYLSQQKWYVFLTRTPTNCGARRNATCSKRERWWFNCGRDPANIYMYWALIAKAAPVDSQCKVLLYLIPFGRNFNVKLWNSHFPNFPELDLISIWFDC